MRSSSTARTSAARIGSVPGLANIDPKSYVEQWRAAQAGDWARVKEIQDHLARLMFITRRVRATVGFGAGVGAFKTALWQMGVFNTNQMREPVQPLVGEDVATIVEVLKAEGMMDPDAPRSRKLLIERKRVFRAGAPPPLVRCSNEKRQRRYTLAEVNTQKAHRGARVASRGARHVRELWLEHGMDKVNGGVYTCLDRKGEVYSTDKSVWMQGRCAWMFSYLCHLYGRRPEWMEAAKSCLDFLEDHRINHDAGGRLYFTVTAEGAPLRQRRYCFSEGFYAIANAEYYGVTGEAEHLERARRAYHMIYNLNNGLIEDPTGLGPKTIAETRTGRGPRRSDDLPQHHRHHAPRRSREHRGVRSPRARMHRRHRQPALSSRARLHARKRRPTAPLSSITRRGAW